METTKQCNKCTQHLPLSSFCKNKNAADGYNWTCKTCVKEYQLSIKDKIKAYQREYQKQYKIEHKEELYAYVRQWKSENPEKNRANQRAFRLRQKLKKLNEKQPTSGTHLQ